MRVRIAATRWCHSHYAGAVQHCTIAVDPQWMLQPLLWLVDQSPCRTAAVLRLPYLRVYGCVVLYGPLHGYVGAAGLDLRHGLGYLLDLGGAERMRREKGSFETPFRQADNRRVLLTAVSR